MAYLGLAQDLEATPDLSAPVLAIDLEQLVKGHKLPISWRYSEIGFNGAVGPIAVTDELVLTSSLSGLMVALDRVTGRVVWKIKLDGSGRFAGPVVHKGKVYVPTVNDLLVLAEGTGKCVGKYRFEHHLMAYPTVRDDRLFVATSGYLWCLKRQD